MQQGAVDVVTLHRLTLLPATKNVTRIFEYSIEEANARSIFEIAKAESVWNPLRLIDVQHYEEV